MAIYVVCQYESDVAAPARISALGCREIVGVISLDIDHHPSFDPSEFANEPDIVWLNKFCARCSESGCDWSGPTLLAIRASLEESRAIIASVYGLKSCEIDDFEIWNLQHDKKHISVIVITEYSIN